VLVQSNLPIIEVAVQVDFLDQSHFTATFRKLSSMTPRVYRNAVLSRPLWLLAKIGNALPIDRHRRTTPPKSGIECCLAPGVNDE
jgi:hypothetical protein